MKMSEGVEWALHTCVNLSWTDPGDAVPAARLAEVFSLPTAYLSKHLQALARAGILISTTGPRGGFRLGRDPASITLLDVVTAIEGPEDAFRCRQILKDGPGGRPDVDYRRTCTISQAMRKAELAWRTALAEQTIADVRRTVEQRDPAAPEATRERLR
ncbi:Rrf2 family transcriptional regulator [Nocardiopsis sp. N85]|uniref:RrF2 family transcriptional regulator n=1 Tax=Nocardiopsis sp. N85 TaxID=3029400 RepID=UPI00237F2B31|nr:Rrf2 family transcriptional regulator [Nocardiopsis sp. N85]MDE3725207.1 Rrf2 family transcriptional regulator [Nocardiopsis sp. N85]